MFFFFLDPVTSEKTIKENLSYNIIYIRKAELIRYTRSGVRFYENDLGRYLQKWAADFQSSVNMVVH